MSISGISSSDSVALALSQIQSTASVVALSLSQDSAVATQAVLAASGALASSSASTAQVYSPAATSIDLAASQAALGNALNIAV